jgi:myosin-7
MSIVSEVEDDVPGTTILDNDDEASQTRLERAAQVCYDISKYPYLRAPDDFTKGIFLNKDKVKTQFLVFQSTVLHCSLLVLDSSEKDRLAIQIHKNLLGYMGDLSIPCPEMLAQDILKKGIEHKYIRDEIYTQIIKQLSNNPKSNSTAKGWQLMCMCIGTFPPSRDFENYLFHFIIEKRDKATGAVANYARYCLRTLEAILSNGNYTDIVLSIEEIQAYKSRPPILATIYLVDNNVVTEDFPIKPYLNVSKIIEMCAGWLGLKDVRASLLGIFVYDLGDNGTQETTNLYDDLPRTPRALRNDDFMGDVIVQKANQDRKFKFILKKKIFLPRFNYRGDDSIYERLVYLQAKDDALVQGNIVVDEESAAKLARLSMAVAYGKAIGSTVNELVEAGLIDFIVHAWRDVKPLEYWANTILENRDALVVAETSDLQDQFLQIVYKSQSYGTHWFYAHYREAGVVGPEPFSGLPYDLQLGLNYEGVHVYTFDYVLLASFAYSDIVEWSGSSDEFTIIINLPHDETYEFTIITAQAPDIAAIIMDYITAIMEELKKDNDVKEVKDDELQYYAYYS